MLENLPGTVLPRLLRRTVVSTVIVGSVAVAVALFEFPPTATVGLVAGIALAIVNLRFLDHQTARVELKGEQTTKAVRRQLGGRTLQRLFLLTAVVLVAIFLNVPLGMGIVAGLMLYQIVFVINLARVIAGSGGIG